MTELKPCPFCGSGDVKALIPYFADDCYMVQCFDCNCNSAVYMTVDQAIEAWNRRTLKMPNDITNNMVDTIHQLETQLGEAKRLLKSAISEWPFVCEWGDCSEHCEWYVNGQCSQEWGGKAEALTLIGEDGDIE